MRNSLSLLLLVLAAPLHNAFADDGVLTSTEIQVLNFTSQRLEFFLALNSEWTAMYLDSNRDVVIPRRGVLFAILTGQTGADALPQPAEISLGDGAHLDGPGYYVRHVQGGKRWYLCWSISKKAWVATNLGEQLCEGY